MTAQREPLPALVSTAWLAARLGAPGVRVLDASWYLPAAGRDAAGEYLAGHIPGAVFFDLDATSDQASPLPHMLPAAQQFARQMSTLGLSHADDIVVYDGSGHNISAARAWWTFRAFGHERTAVLDGGFGRWRAEGRPVEQGTVLLAPAAFTARLDQRVVRSLADVLANLESRREQIVDARPAGRFAGVDPEPRAGLRGGHVPGSLSLPYHELVAADGTLRPPEELRRRLAAAGLDLTKPVVATCGSGTSACAIALALHVLGYPDTAIYDGAWTEWGGRSDTPVEIGPP